MKKVLVILVTVLMILTFAGCKKEAKSPEPKSINLSWWSGNETFGKIPPFTGLGIVSEMYLSGPQEIANGKVVMVAILEVEKSDAVAYVDKVKADGFTLMNSKEGTEDISNSVLKKDNLMVSIVYNDAIKSLTITVPR